MQFAKVGRAWEPATGLAERIRYQNTVVAFMNSVCP